jgi:hypothetical protein
MHTICGARMLNGAGMAGLCLGDLLEVSRRGLTSPAHAAARTRDQQ